MTFRSIRFPGENASDVLKCDGVPFETIDASFDGPRPIEVTFQVRPPNVERLYAVEMRAEDVAAGLGALADEGRDEFQEPGNVFVDSTVWREARAAVFVGDAGSGTPPHHDIVAQIELCHVLTGSKMIAAAPWGEPSRDLEALSSRRRRGDDVDDDDDDDEPVLNVPTHRALLVEEAAILRCPGLCVVHARPGDTVVFSSAASHFAVNGASGPCAACFHGALTPASTHALAAHFDRLDPFSEEELRGAGFGGHLTGRRVLTEEIGDTAGYDATRRDEASDAERALASYRGNRLRADEIGPNAAAVAAARFRESTRRMAEARETAARRGRALRERLKNGEGSGTAEEWPEARRTTFFV